MTKVKHVKTKHAVHQLGSVWLWTMARKIMVKDILEFAEGLKEANAPLDGEVQFEKGHLHYESMTVEWETEE